MSRYQLALSLNLGIFKTDNKHSSKPSPPQNTSFPFHNGHLSPTATCLRPQDCRCKEIDRLVVHQAPHFYWALEKHGFTHLTRVLR